MPSRGIVTLGLALIAIGAGSCAEVLTPGEVLIRPKTVTLSGSPISATVAQVVSSPARFVVLDDDGIPMQDREVAFLVSGGSVIPASMRTNSAGEVAVTSWTMPTTAGSATLTARAIRKDAQDPEPSAVLTATVAPGAPASITAQPASATSPVNSTVPVTVTARDVYSNPVGGVRLAFQPGESPTNAVVTSSNPDITNSNGIVNVAWRIDTLVRSNTLRVTGVEVTSLSATATVQGTAGSAARITSVSSRSQPGTPSTPVASIPEVRVADQYDNPVGGALVTFAAAASSGTITGPAGSTCSTSTTCQVTTGADGRAKLASWTLGTAIATHTLNVSVGTSLTLTPPFTALATRDLLLTALTVPATGEIGGSIAVSATVQNAGTLSAVATTVAFRFSTNSTITTSDPLSATTCVVPALAGGATHDCALDVAVPSTVTAGAWFVGATVDPSAVITETDETNNVRVSSGTVALALPAPPAAPTNLVATPSGSSQITLTWTDNSSNESGFRIERCLGTTCSLFSEIGTVGANVTTYTSTGLGSQSTYRFQVRAYNIAGSSAYTTIVAATTLAVGVDLQVTAVTTAATSATTGSTIAVSATIANLGNTAAPAFRAGFRWSTNTAITTSDVFSGTSCDVPALAAGASFACANVAVAVPLTLSTGAWYVGALADDLSQVSEVDEFNNGLATATTIAVSPSIPAAPTGLAAATISGSQINLSWTDNASNEDGFRVERCSGTGCSSFVEIATVGTNSVSYSSTGLSTGVSYSYRVRAHNTGGTSSYSNTASATTGNAPGAPSNLNYTTPTSTQIDLTWIDNTSFEDGFRIERCTGSGCTSFVEIATVGVNVTGYSNTGLTPLTTYRYRVRSYNAIAASSYTTILEASTPANGIELHVTSVTAPATGVAGGTISVSTVIGNRGVAASGAFRAGIYYSTDPTITTSDTYSGSSCSYATFTSKVSTTCSLPSTVVPNTLPAGVYYVGVVIDDLAQVAESDETNNGLAAASTTTISVAVPGTPSNIAAIGVNANQITVMWTDNATNETGYRIERCTGQGCGDFTEVATVGSNVTSYANSTLSAGTFYNYRVRAYNTVSGNSSYSGTAGTFTGLSLTNTSFSSGSTGWTLSGNAFVLTSPTTYRTSPAALFLGTNSSGTGLDNVSGTATQTFVVPSNATTATLSFYFCITTDEPATTTLYDVLNVTVRDNVGNTLATADQRSNVNAVSSCGPSSGYALKTFSVQSLRGQLLTLHFNASNDSVYPSVFRIDDVTVTWSP